MSASQARNVAPHKRMLIKICSTSHRIEIAKGSAMKLESQYAHDLVEQFVAWNQAEGQGPHGHRRASSFVVAKKKRGRLNKNFCDEHADLVDALLSHMSETRQREYEVLMYYYEHGQSQAATAKRFGLHASAVDTLVNTALGYLDGQVEMLRLEAN